MRKLIHILILAAVIFSMTALTSCDTDEPAETDESGNVSGTLEETSSGTLLTDDATTEDATPADSTEGEFSGYVLTLSSEGGYDISDNLFGIFIEDINFSVDGGLYAELVYNRSFEYTSQYSTGGAKTGWTKSTNVTWDVIDGSEDGSCLNEHNTHYARVTNSSSDDAYGIFNRGYFNDMAVTEGADYTFSVYLRSVDGYDGRVYVSIESTSGVVYASDTIEAITDSWYKYTVTLTSSETASSNVRLALRIDEGTVDVDFVSLFPVDTYKGRENGLRKDIAEMIEALEPKFLRFPGGCVIEGQTLETTYDWKDSIGDALEFTVNGETTVGDVAARELGYNIWGNTSGASEYPYYMTYGMGFYEFFLFCEDLGCEPIPVVNCGLACESRNGYAADSVALNSVEMQQYIQDMLDLIEFCNGGTDTTWGAVRAAMGHEETFDLKYIAVGNEQYGSVYYTRYALFLEALREAAEENPEVYGGVEIILANGLASGSTDGWDMIESEGTDYADLLDEHYYNAPAWFLTNTIRYDSYDRSNPAVFIGEYAAQSNTSLAAIAEAAYMTSIERNGDIVELAAYAPLLAYDGHTQWAPDLIWFSNDNVWGSNNYYTQKLFSTNLSDSIISSTLDSSRYISSESLEGKLGVGTWQTSARFYDISVVDNDTGEVLYSQDFSDSSALDDFKVIEGTFSVRNGMLTQSNTGYPSNDITGDVAYFGESDWTNYTYTVTAKKMSGAEGFLIPFAVGDSENFWHWNIGGWANTVSCLEYTLENGKSGQVAGTVKSCTIESGVEYEIKVVVSGCNVKCYLNGELMIDYDAMTMFTVVGEDEDDYIIKLVNTEMQSAEVKIDLSCFGSFEREAEVQYIRYYKSSYYNTEGNEKVCITTETINVTECFVYEVPKYSAVVIRIPKS
ncbi:MAG: carbohydrate binding domain-containing protein, partial [Firmicutes bacterium]|nr:carbohydrate binding domain-containing protein [Bacillota bacterium]